MIDGLHVIAAVVLVVSNMRAEALRHEADTEDQDNTDDREAK